MGKVNSEAGRRSPYFTHTLSPILLLYLSLLYVPIEFGKAEDKIFKPNACKEIIHSKTSGIELVGFYFAMN
jgi:hypothetical protein